MKILNSIGRKAAIFLEMIKFEHSVFALPFAYFGLFLAEQGWPRLPAFFWVTVAMVSFRTYGMSINRILDQKIDSQNPRTKNRALPAGQLKASFVLGAAFFSVLIFEISAYQLSSLCFKFSPIPLVLATLYPMTKRFTWLCHFVLGIILGIAPYGAWLASQNRFDWIPGLLSIGVICWVSGFDMIYALQDYEFDRQSGLFSFPARFGKQNALKATGVLHATAVLAWLGAGWLAQLGIIYFLGLILASGLLIRESWLVVKFGLARLEEAFFKLNAVISFILFLSVLFDFVFQGVFK